MKELGLLLIAMCLIFTTCSIQKLTEAIHTEGHRIDFSIRSARYDYILRHVTYECSTSRGPTISCTENVMKCIDKENSKAGDFNYMGSYIKCQGLIKK